jgi:hypothetical protein
LLQALCQFWPYFLSLAGSTEEILDSAKETDRGQAISFLALA